jgi:2-methylcitrate dehydratase
VTIAEQLSEQITAPHAIDDNTIAYAKQLVMSCVGAMIAGADLEASTIIRRHAESYDFSRLCTVAGTNLKTSPETAALLNGTFAHATEYEDDSFPEGVSTFTVIPPILAIAEEEHVDGLHFLRSVVIAHEIQSRLGLACLDGFERGYQLLPVMGTIGSAGGVAHVKRLDPVKTAAALCISTSQAGGLRVQSRSMTHFLESGTAARAGILSASLAAIGYDAEPLAFEGRKVWRAGFLNAIGAPDGAEADVLADFLETAPRINQVCIKERPMCMFLQPLAAALDIALDNAVLEPNSVEEIIVYASTPFIGACDVPDPRTHSQAAFSLQHVAAVTTLHGASLNLDSFRENTVDSAEIRDIRSRVRIVPRDDWDTTYMNAPTAVEVRLKSGKVLEAQVEDVYGMPPRYMTSPDVEKKFRTAVNGIVSPDRQDRIIEAVRSLDRCDDTARLMQLLGRE